MDLLAGVRHWLLDVEGTLVVDKGYRPVPGAPDWFRALKAAGHSARILTNNSTHTHDELAARLQEAGFDVAADEIISGQSRAAEVLASRGVRECWVLGSEALDRSLSAAGLQVHRIEADASEDVAAAPPGQANGAANGASSRRPVGLVMGYLAEVNVALFSKALDLALRRECVLVALHKNHLYRNRDRIEPGLGAWVSALEYASGKQALILGKPSPRLFLAAARSLGVETREIAMVGDDPFADLAPARELNMKTVLVLSGKYRDAGLLDDLPDALRPDLVVQDISALPLG